MPTRLPMPPIDTAPIKDVARSLRFAVQQGGRTLRKGLPLEALPEPAARFAGAALSTAQKLGDRAERGASTLVHALLDGDDTPPPLSQPDEVAAEARFAAAAHDGLKLALLQLGAETCLVSEAACAAAWRRVAHAGPADGDSAMAADLMLALLAAPALREVIWAEGAIPPQDAPRLAAFAVLLAMLADASGFRTLLPATTDIALAVAGDLAAAAGSDNLKTLFDEFRNHV